MNYAMLALIKKDFSGITSNRRLMLPVVLVPLILTVLLPSVFLLAIQFAPEDPDILKMLELLPAEMRSDSVTQTAAGMILNYIMPAFFLMIPIMTSSIMAAGSFVGEKEKHTLETLLCCPLTLRQIFCAKVFASFLLSMFASLLSFLVMILVLGLESFFLMGTLLLPGANWILVILLISPAISLIAITLIVKGSAKAQSVEESQQSAVFLILPVILLVAGQFSGLMLLRFPILLIVGILCALLAWVLLKKAMKRFTYELLLK